MTPRRGLIGASVVVIVLILGFLLRESVLSWQHDRQEAHHLNIGVATWIGYGALYIAQERHLFSGANITLTRIDDTAAYNSAMIKGDIDGYCNTMDSFALAAGSGVQGKVVYLFDESAGADGIVAKPEIQSIQDLRGKRVAAQTGWPGHFFLLYLTSNAGIHPADFTLVSLDADKAGAAFMSGDLDAAVTWEPWLSKISQSGHGHILVSSRDNPGVIMDGLIMSPHAVETHSDDIKVLVSGIFEAIRFWKKNPAEGNRIVAKAFGLSETEVGNMIKGVHYLDQDTNREYLQKHGQANETLNMAASVWKDAGILKAKPDLSDVVTDSFVR